MEICLYTLLRRWAEDQPDAPYLYHRDEVVTYAQANERALRLAAALRSSGIRPGDRVALMMANRPELVYAYFACFRLGAIAVPVNTRYTRREANYVLEHSGAKTLIAGTEFFPVIEPLCRKGELHEHTILVDGARNGVDHYGDFDACVDAANPVNDWPPVDPDRPAVMLHTSGSTAQPKGVVHSHRTLFHVGRLNAELYDVANHATTGIYLSMLYIGGLGLQLIRNTCAGSACAIIENREIGSLLKAVAQYKITDLVLMPTDLVFLLDHPDSAKTDWSSLDFIITGGDKGEAGIHEKVRALTGVHPLEGYGMTECSPIAAMPPQGPIIPGSMGPAVPGVEIELRHPGGGLVPSAEIGELWARSPAAFVEYWNNPAETARTKVDGWVTTGDRARRDADGYYWFEGRSKLIIVRHGSNIAPQEVEEVIDHHPAVMSSCVVGLPHPTLGEQVCAMVEVRPGKLLTEAELIDYARHHIAEYKAPEKVIFLERMPTNSSGKLDRMRMKQFAVEQFSQISAHRGE